MAPKLVRANRSFAAVAGDAEYFVREGELFPATHRLVKDHPELFSGPEAVVEQATAAPGEKRNR
jgi:hypothetical protein